MPFAALGLSDLILRSLNEQGYSTPTPIQAKSIPPILEGRDVLGCAQTGTGKTAAFSLPLIHRLSNMPIDKARRGPALPRALILSPTRELAAQIAESVATYGKHVGLSHTVIYGGVSQHHQVKALQRGVDIVIATPGRLLDLMQQRYVNLSAVSIFVLDEADRMLDMGFIQPIRTIAAALPKGPRQTLLFSATMPKEIMHLAESLLRDPVRVAVTPVASAAPLIEQRLYMIPSRRKQALLEHFLADSTVKRAVVFTKTKHGADRVCNNLHRDGVDAIAIHGNKSQNFRTRALDAFRSGRMRVLVATDVAARGLDVDNISHVFNFDLPMEPEAYVHRIGRTARAGASGIAISFCDPAERGLLRDVERLLKKPIPSAPLPAQLPEPEPAPHHRPMGLAPGSPASHRNNEGWEVQSDGRSTHAPSGHNVRTRGGHRGQPRPGQAHPTHNAPRDQRDQRDQHPNAPHRGSRDNRDAYSDQPRSRSSQGERHADTRKHTPSGGSDRSSHSSSPKPHGHKPGPKPDSKNQPRFGPKPTHGGSAGHKSSAKGGKSIFSRRPPKRGR
ncbi:MAG: DEAD/DEAH box helicase [Planctomycetota bacterium]|nr:DEAD/DEAH box helicase [Planctomycetota bacterium]